MMAQEYETVFFPNDAVAHSLQSQVSSQLQATDSVGLSNAGTRTARRRL